MKNMAIIVTLIFTLTACASNKSNDDEWVKANNSDLIQLNHCTDIEREVERSKQQLAHLQKAQQLQNKSNALTVGAGLLSLDPTFLFRIGSTDKINESIQSFEERIKLLQNKLANCVQ